MGPLPPTTVDANFYPNPSDDSVEALKKLQSTKFCCGSDFGKPGYNAYFVPISNAIYPENIHDEIPMTECDK